jgi:hypothetical protein
MIIGSGLIANTFREYVNDKENIIFASGVSNSSESRSNEFQREKELLSNTVYNYPNKTLVYFSTCAFDDKYFSESSYLIHKKEMEFWIFKNVSSYYIFRIPQLIGSNNETQLIGFLNSRIQKNLKFTLFDIERNIIDLEFLRKSVNYIIENDLLINQKINISYPENIRVKRIVEIFEKIYSKRAIYELKQINGSFKIDNSDLINQIFHKLGLIKLDFFESKLKEYYG